MKRSPAILLCSLVAAATVAVPAVASGATGCQIAWGSIPESAGTLTQAQLAGVRTGSHPCYDRLVVDLAGRTAGYRVSYVDQVRADGSGAVVPLRGGARVQVVVLAPAHDPRPAMPSTTGMRTFRQVAWAGSFEGQTTLGLGVRARLPFRVFVLSGDHPRLVLDVAHTW